ncbi:MAG: hypothetical protein PHF74_07500 [Dehalococcoidales bacterium]|nr:hypothetical protein [Dehalococcoidales bacterium]
MTDKPTYNDYKVWLLKECGVAITEDTHYLYDDNIKAIKAQLENSPFWKELCNNLKAYNQACYSDYGYNLFNTLNIPEIKDKEFSSFLEKTYRLNILRNDNYPKPHVLYKEWIVPSNWFEKVNDCIRTTFIVTYLDGVTFFKEKLQELCKKTGNSFHCYP